MSTQSWVSRIPTLDRLGITVSESVDVDHATVAKEWLETFAAFISLKEIDGILRIVCEDALWRDILALTWDIRTFDGATRIRQFLSDRLSISKMQRFKPKGPPVLQKPAPDLAWIVAMFEFENDVGLCSGVVRLVPTSDGKWRAYTIFTNLEDLKSYPELIGAHRSHEVLSSGDWVEKRQKETDSVENDPSVLIIGAGQSALALAARLKHMGVPTLMVDKEKRVGDSWRNRYENLALHFPVWWDHMPYLPFPPTWPVYPSAYKIADWLESYAKIFELHIWTSSTVLGATQDRDHRWSVRVKRSDGAIRTLQVNHLVFATGIGDGMPKPLGYPGQEKFAGIITHSTQYKRADEYKGKKVIVIGAANSAFDIASDLAKNSVDVTMFQRSSTVVINIDRAWKYLGGALYNENTPSLDIADRLAHSMPQLVQENGLGQRAMVAIAEDYNDVLDKLRNIGFRLNSGLKDAGIALQNKEKGGGYLFGASQLLIDGSIKLKNDSQIREFVEDGLIFENGTKLTVDAVICATGLGDMRDHLRQICGDEVAKNCPPLLGVDMEGEMSWYRRLHRPGLWYMIGPFSMNRFFSKTVALQIKAMDEKLITSRYTPIHEVFN